MLLCRVCGCGSANAMENTSDEQLDLDLTKYIDASKLSSMSDLEKKCCANRIRNYEMMKSIGIMLHVLKIHFVNCTFRSLCCGNSILLS